MAASTRPFAKEGICVGRTEILQTEMKSMILSFAAKCAVLHYVKMGSHILCRFISAMMGNTFIFIQLVPERKLKSSNKIIVSALNLMF